MFLEPLPPSPDSIAWATDRVGLPNLSARLLLGYAGSYAVPGTDCVVIMSAGLTRDTGVRALWIEALGGEAPLRPHDNMKAIEATMADCVDIARASRCSEIRIEANNRTALKGRLFRRFGFVPEEIYGHTVMRKALLDG